MRLHFFNTDDLSSSKAASAQWPILGNSGPLKSSKKAKLSARSQRSFHYLTASALLSTRSCASFRIFHRQNTPKVYARLILFDGRLRFNAERPRHDLLLAGEK